MKQGFLQKLLLVGRILPICLCILCVGFYLTSGEDLSLEAILHVSPSHPFLATLFLLALYAFKSISIIFPILIPQVIGGLLFPPAAAICINLFGMAIALALPYWVGFFSDAGAVSRFMNKYPKTSIVFSVTKKNPFFASFFLRLISCLPGDVVGMYLGALNIPFRLYLPAGMLGVLPGTIAATLLGISVSDRQSPLFLFAILMTVLLSVSSLAIYSWYLRKTKKQEAE